MMQMQREQEGFRVERHKRNAEVAAEARQEGKTHSSATQGNWSNANPTRGIRAHGTQRVGSPRKTYTRKKCQ